VERDGRNVMEVYKEIWTNFFIVRGEMIPNTSLTNSFSHFEFSPSPLQEIASKPKKPYALRRSLLENFRLFLMSS